MILRFVRRPAFPGETNHELVWTLVFILSCIIGFIFFQLGGTSPSCLFYKLTTIPCLGCGATRCARELSHLNFWSAFKYHPSFFILFNLGLVWTLYSLVFWISGSSLRLRLVIDEAARRTLWVCVFIVAFIHWVWQCYYLR
ncbi:MAG: DUF2752 domain-containing protein [Verrucomicrobia bacterium]|nr:DUF2752 domain-containing protein [Verrucomicrobiota bacterium]